MTSIEICAGAGGQAIGLEKAGFEHLALVELEAAACKTLRHNRPEWNVLEMDVRQFDAKPFKGIDLFAGGVPCPPFSVAGKQLGESDERDLFPEALRIVEEAQPKAVLIENVKGLMSRKFIGYRKQLLNRLRELGYTGNWKLLFAADYGVPQLRPRSILVAFKDDYWRYFQWPEPQDAPPPSVGDVLYKLISANNWEGADEWRDKAKGIAPTLVGGSKKHGGADLGPTRARNAWAELGVDGRSLANHPPARDFEGMPKLTLQMTAIIQGFPASWEFQGKKTPAYRQIGNAFPPPVAKSLGVEIKKALKKERVVIKPGIEVELEFPK